MIKKLILMLLFFLLLNNSAFGVDKPQIYTPYPIVFVSGIGTKNVADNSNGSPSKRWPQSSIFQEFTKYFIFNGAAKYEDSPIGTLQLGEKSHLEFFFYDAQQNTLATNAKALQKQIDEILFGNSNVKGYYDTSTYTYTNPCSTPKVILVCHSLGGLIARYMLVHDDIYNMRDKVAAVFFIGSQQQGSPLAPVGYFLPKEIIALRADIRDMDSLIDSKKVKVCDIGALRDIQGQENKKIENNLHFMQWGESSEGMYVSTRDKNDNEQLETALNGTKWLALFHKLLPPNVTEKGVIRATLINNPLANSYSHTFKNGYGDRYSLSRKVSLSYSLSAVPAPDNELDFSNSPEDRSIGVTNVHAIAGDDFNLVRDLFCLQASQYLGKVFNEKDYSCISGGLWDSGDGFSNLVSQGLIGKYHQIHAAHFTLLPWLSIIGITGECEFRGNPPGILGTSDIILQAIEDDPVIESVYAVPVNWNATPNDDSYNRYYLIFKVKDYLLADVEIDALTIGGVSVDDLEKYKGSDNKYKPYNFLKQVFLKERICDGKNGSEKIEYTDIQGNPRTDLKLEPGEFSVRTQLFDGQAVYIKIKNPAAQYNTDPKFTAKKTFYVVQPKIYASWTDTGTIDVPPYIEPPSSFWPHSSSLYFNIQDSPTKDIRLNAWLYSRNFKDMYKKFATDYTPPSSFWTSSRDETLPDGHTTVTLHSGEFDADHHPFPTWYGQDDNGNYVPTNQGGDFYITKVTVGPPNAYSNNKVVYILGFGLGAISIDPTFIQPSRRESVTW